jgi:hypothetical protein
MRRQSSKLPHSGFYLSLILCEPRRLQTPSMAVRRTIARRVRTPRIGFCSPTQPMLEPALARTPVRPRCICKFLHEPHVCYVQTIKVNLFSSGADRSSSELNFLDVLLAKCIRGLLRDLLATYLQTSSSS